MLCRGKTDKREGYRMIDNQRGAKRRVGYNHLISSKPE